MSEVDQVDWWWPWRVVPRLASGIVAMPIVAGFVALGAIVIVGRSLRDVVLDGWARLPARRSGAARVEADEAPTTTMRAARAA